MKYSLIFLFNILMLVNSAAGDVARGLVAWYKFDGNADDSSGNGNHCVANGATLTTDRFGNANSAYYFDGNAQSIQSVSDPVPAIEHTYTVSLWFQTSVPLSSHGSSRTEWNPGNYVFFPRHGGSGAGNGIKVGTDGIQIVEHGGGYLPTILTYAVSIGNGWNHVVFTVADDGDPNLYLNGELVAKGTASSREKSVAMNDIGGGTWGYYKGKIDDVRFYKRTLSATQVKALYEGSDPIEDASLIKFNANGGTPKPVEIMRKNGEEYGTLPTVKRGGYVFDGWYTAASGGAKVASTDVVNSDATLFARWTLRLPPVLKGSFVCTQYDLKYSPPSLSVAKLRVADSYYWVSDPVMKAYDVISFSDDDSAMRGFETVAFPGNATKDDKKDGFVMIAQGRIVIPESGDWSFACGSDDGFELTLKGEGHIYSMAHDSTRSYDTSVQVFNLQAGEYDLDLFYFEYTGGAGCTLSAARGSYSSFDSSVFKLIGDSACLVETLGQCVVSFDLNGGEQGPEPLIFTEGESYGELPIAYQQGCVFDGWYTEAMGGKKVSAWLAVVGNTTLYAHWAEPTEVVSLSDVEVVSGKLLNSVMIAYTIIGKLGGQKVLEIKATDNETGIVYDCNSLEGIDLSEGRHLVKWDAAKDGIQLKSADVVFSAKLRDVEYLSDFFNKGVDCAGTGGDANWIMDGMEMRSGDIEDLQASWAETEIVGPAEISFEWRVSSEDQYDWLEFALDGVTTYKISGEQGWEKRSVSVGVGAHILRWRYKKDQLVSEGADCGWVRNLAIENHGVVQKVGDGAVSAASASVETDGRRGGVLSWGTGGVKIYDNETVDWALVSDVRCSGGSCVKSGDLEGEGSESWLSVTVDEPGTISFKYKVQSYSGVFAVMCDGAELFRREGPTGSSVKWETASVNITKEGTHHIRFVYQHGGVSYGSGHNGVMLDDFGFTPSHCHVILKANNGTDDSKEILVKLNELSALPKVMFSQFNSTFQGWAMSETGSVKYSDGATVNFSDRTVVLYAQWRAYSYAEILDVSGCEFQSGGNGNWSLDTAVSKFGGHSVRSGSIGDRQSSWMRTSVTGPTVMTFWWKVSSEADYDFLKVLVDGDEVKSISGETDWQEVSLVIQAGTHTVEWQYAKDQASVSGSDCGWVDRVGFSTAYVVTFDGNGGTASVVGKAYAPRESYGELPACARSGSRFLGWFTQADGGTEIKSADVVSSNVTLYAHWEEIPCGLLMRYYDGVGNAYTQWTQSFDSLLSYFYARTPTLTEWSETNTDTLDFGVTSSGCKYHGKYASSSANNFAMWMTGYIDLKFYGEYEFNVKSDDGFVLYVDGRLVANYTGDRGMDGSGTSGKIALTKGVHRIDLVHRDGSGDHGLCLTFKEPFGDELVNIQQTDCPKGAAIRFETGEGAMDGFERRYVEGLPIVDLPSPVREGYDFIGWFTREDGGLRVEASDVFEGQATLFAHWEVRADVKFDANGGTCGTATHHYTKGTAYGWLPSCTRTGCDFVGWYTTSGGGTRVEVGSTVTGGGTLYAHWQKQLQDLTFDTAGGCAVGTISVPYGERVGNLPIPTKDGCVFDGWYDRAVGGSRLGPDAVITAGQKLYAHWKDADEDEVWLSDNELDICSGARRTSEVQLLTMSPAWKVDGVKAIVSVDGVPYREATSAGECMWAGTRTKEYTLTHQIVDASGATVGEPYVAKFNWVNRVTVTFECQNGDTAITKTYDEASAYGELPVVTRTGYAFDGWYTAASGGTKVSETDIVPGAMTFYAHWINNRYSIRFHANGGEGQMEDQSFSYDNAQDLSATAFTRTGYTFAGWATSAGGQVAYGNGQSVKNLTADVNVSIDLYAVWNKNAYLVKFNANGGSGSMANESMTYDEEKALTACAFTRTGYAFAGWATSAGGEIVYVNGQSVKNLTATQGTVVNLYAKWMANGYAVAFNANGGLGSMANESMTYDTTKALTACAFTRTGYTFAGWATSAGGTVKYADGATIKNLAASGTVTLYAKWTPNSYVIDFNPGQGGEGSMPDQPMTYDEEAALYANLFARTGYTFLGWTDDPNEVEEVLYYDGVVVENLTDEDGGEYDLYAIWAANEYTVKFNANGGKGTMADQAFLYDAAQNLTSNGFVRAGCEFLGWTMSAVGEVVYADGEAVSNLMVTADGVVNLYAVWDGTATTWMEDDSFSAVVANTYDGYLIDEDYNLFGVVQVKTTKQSVKTTTDKKTKVKTVTTNITATATVTDANGKKWSYSKGVVTVDGAVAGLKCTTKGCPVPEFGVKVGKNGMDSVWGEYAIFGARNGMGTKGDAMMTALEAYKGKWSVTIGTLRLQLDVQAKGVVKIAGNWESGAKVSASAQLVMGDGFAYVPMMVKSTKTSPTLNALLRIAAGDEVVLLSEGDAARPESAPYQLVAGGRTVAAIEIVEYLAENPVKAGVAYVGRVALNELAYPAKFMQKGLPTGLKIDAATGVVSGTPTKPGEYEVTFTATSSMNSKSNDVLKTTIKIENYVDGLIPVEDYYGPYTPGKSYTVTIPAAGGCTVSGMPTGMKWTAKDVKAKDGTVTTPANSIYGIPTKPGKYTVYFKKSVSEVNAKGKSVKVTHTATATFEVADYPTITILPSLAIAGSEPMSVTEGSALSFFVGVKQSFAINLAGTLDGVDTTVSAKGLPSGLKLVKKTIYVDPTAKKKVVDHYEYVIEGVPTKVSTLDKQKNVVPSHVALTASNKYKWSGTLAFDITVVALPKWAYGTFNGGNTNGMVTLTVSNVGKLSGKWMSAGLTWTLSAASFDAYISSEQMYVATVIGKSGKLAMTNEIEVTEGDVSSPLWEAWRNGWKEEPQKSLATKLKGQKVQVGEVLLTVGASGAVTAKGTFVTGFDEAKQKDITYSASCSTVLIPTAEADQYKVYLYFPPKAGKFGGFTDVVEIGLGND